MLGSHGDRLRTLKIAGVLAKLQFSAPAILRINKLPSEKHAIDEYEKTVGVKPSEISYTSFGPMIGIMLDPEMEMFTGIDLLFSAIALGAAWKFASGNREEAG